MANYEVLHVRKIKTMVGCIQVIKHNLRKKDNLEEFIDITKSFFNFYNGASEENFFVLFERLTSHLPRKIQCNASRIIEFVVSFSHEFGEGWEENPELKKKIERFFNDVEAFLKRRYGDVIICRADHYDEKTPHSHILIVPLCKNRDGIVKFSSSEFLGGRNGLFDLHDKFHKEVGIQYGLERGKRDSRTIHSGLKNYEEWEREQRRYIEEQKRLLNEQLAEVQRQQALNAQSEILLNEEKRNQFEQRGKLLAETAKVKNKEKELELLDKSILEQTPQIPIPPPQITENSRKAWAEEVQEKINSTFSKIIKGYFFLKKKYDSLCRKLKKMTNLKQQYKDRAERAERDLSEKPISEIISMREERKKIELEKKKTTHSKVSSL